MENTEKKYDVSRETIEKLKAYEASLHEWQKRFNLVSNSSLEDSWNRHFEDSMQLFKYIPNGAKTLVDFGSGAGFPAMVLAVMAVEKTPYLNISLVESTTKKTLYLKEVAKITNVNVEIINERIEKIKTKTYDVVTSRALASLTELFMYTIRFCGKKTVCIFPKGKRYAEEISEAKKDWRFDYEAIPSQTSDEGVVLIIKNLSRR